MYVQLDVIFLVCCQHVRMHFVGVENEFFNRLGSACEWW